MAKEVKDAVVEEPVAVAEEPVDAEGTEEELSPWYVFCSTGCGFCKKAEPVVEALNKEGYDILTLDLSEPDNAKLNNELKAEYGVQCGTPWFINADTGKGICGFREKDVLKKWLAGEDIPVPPRPTGPMPKPPFQGSTNKEEIAWKKTYKKWLKDNKHMGDDWNKRQKSASEIADGPRPKSDPPQMPNMMQSTDEQLDEWGVKLGEWQEENKHMPNLQPAATIVQNLKNRKMQMQQQQGQGQAPPTAAERALAIDTGKLNTMDAKVQALEVKIDKLMDHFGVK